jgi:hypothetical protein
MPYSILPLLIAIAIPWSSSMALAGQAKSTVIPTNPAQTATNLQDFKNRVNAYVKLRTNVENSFQSMTTSNDSADIASHKIQLAGMMVAARPTALQGDIFGPEIALQFRETIRKTVQAPGAQATRRTVLDIDPGKPFIVRVNVVYPEDIPVQTTPTALLLSLPELPIELAYRISGRALILLDNKTRLIVDFIPEVIP